MRLRMNRALAAAADVAVGTVVTSAVVALVDAMLRADPSPVALPVRLALDGLLVAKGLVLFGTSAVLTARRQP